MMSVLHAPRPYPVPANEEERLKALHAYGILDTLPEPSFDRITHIAARLFQTPIATISLVDDQRQWFKAKCGLEGAETGRNVSFCAHTIMTADPLIVCDATDDVRFRNNSLVTGGISIRFYAGAPLITREGLALGSLCVIDTVIHHPPATDVVESLVDLAALVVENIEFRSVVLAREQAERERNEAEQRYRLFVETARDVFLIVDEDGFIVTSNRAVTGILGYKPEELIGKPLSLLLPGCVSALREGVIDFKARNHAGDDVAVEISFSRFDSGGRMFTAILRDLRERNLATAALKRTAADLRANQIKLKEAQQLVHLGSWEWDLKTQAISWSDETYQMFGLAPQSGITFEQYQQLLPAADLPRVRSVVSKSLETGEPYTITHSINRSDGSIIYVEGRGRVEHDAEGKPRKLLGTMLDVTPRVQADLFLRESNEKLESRVQERTELLAQTNAAFKAEVELHRRTLQLMAGQNLVLREIAEGLPTGKVFDTLLRFGENEPGSEFTAALLLKSEDSANLCWAAGPWMPAEVKAALQRVPIGPERGSPGEAAYLGKRIVVGDLLQQGASASLAQLAARHLASKSLASTPILGKNNQVLGTISFALRGDAPTESELLLQDACASLASLTLQRDEQQAELQQWEQMFKHAPYGMALASARTGTLLAVNPGYASLLGCSAEELTGKSVFNVLGQPLVAPTLLDGSCFTDHPHICYESEWTRKDGSTVPVLIDVVQICDAEYRPLYWAENVRAIQAAK